MELNNESETLFIPLLGKALMSRDNLFLHDPYAEEIISKVDYDFKTLKQSKWLSMFMSVRALVIDELCNEYIIKHPNATIIHLGCGLDSRCLRVSQDYKLWYDIDYEDVIEIRRNFFNEDDKHKMIGSSVTDIKWLDKIEKCDDMLIVAEGLTMYLSEDEVKSLIKHIKEYFGDVHLLFDAYTKKGVRASRLKNPVNKMNAQIKYGINDPKEFLLIDECLEYVATHLIKYDGSYLHGITKFIFNNLYCGKISQSIYKIYEFNLKR